MRTCRIWFLCLGNLLCAVLIGQNVGIGTSTPDPSALLDMSSTTQGLLVPRMSTSARNAISSPAEGLLVYDTDSLGFYTWRTGTWTSLAGGDGVWQQDSSHVFRIEGNVGIGQPAPTGKLHVSLPNIEMDTVVFTGSGLNDLTVDPAGYDTTGSISYAIRIQNSGPDPNLIEISADGGMTWTGPIPISNPIDMGSGVTATFAATGGHTYNDRWDWTVAQVLDDIFVVAGQHVGIGTALPESRLHISEGDLLLDGGDLILDEGGQIRILDANENFFVGDSSGVSVTPGSPALNNGTQNLGIGQAALFSNTSGYQNLAIGVRALRTNTVGSRNLAIGFEAMKSNTYGIINIAIGTNALKKNTSGNYNTAIGYIALRDNQTGDYNTAVGNGTLYSNVSGIQNTAVGHYALSLTTSTGNTGVGSFALYQNVTGQNNTAVGAETLTYNISGSNNTGVGRRALTSNTGDNNTAIGYEAMKANLSGSSNVSIGQGALYSNTTGINNSASGSQALFSNTTGPANVAAGYRSLFSSTTGGYNTALGNEALYATGTAEYNTAIGYAAGNSYNNGYNNVFVGANVDVTANGRFNVVAIGQGTVVDASSKIYLGNTATGAIGGNVAWSNWSDGRFKQDVQENVPGLAFICRLRPVTYRMKIDALNDHLHGSRAQWNAIFNDQMQAEFAKRSAETRTGFIAQEVEAAALALGFDFDGIDQPAEEGGLYGLRYAEFVVPLVKAVQEQQAIIDAMQTRNTELQTEVAALHLQLAEILARLEATAPTQGSLR